MKNPKADFWKELEKLQKDPEFRKGIKEFVKLTTS
jgi:hypothetical protein